MHLGWSDLVEQAISLNEDLPDVGLLEFGNQTAAFTMDVERGSRLECLDQKALSGGA